LDKGLIKSSFATLEAAMCRFAVDLIDFEELTAAQRKALLKDLQKRRDALQAQLKGVNESLKGVNQALKTVQKVSKRR
jgi:hypothetical protein